MRVKHADCLIVGAGVMGLLSAYELLEKGYSVILLDKGEFGRESSWAGGGILAPLNPLQDTAPINTQLYKRSQFLYPKLVSEIESKTGCDVEFERTGMQYISSSGEIFDFPEVAQCRNPRFLRALIVALEAHSRCTLIPQTPVIGLLEEKGDILGVKTATYTFTADKTVLAMGAWTGEFLKSYGFSIPIVPVKGQMLALQGTPGFLSRILVNEHCYVIPRRDGLLLVGSSVEQVGYNKLPTESVRDSLLSSYFSLLPHSPPFPVIHHWCGLRPGADAPYIGALSKYQNLYIIAGHFRTGLTGAPASVEKLIASFQPCGVKKHAQTN